MVSDGASVAAPRGASRTGPSFAREVAQRMPTAVVVAAYSERLAIIKATRKTLSGRISAQKRGLLLTRFSTDPLIAGDKVGWIRPPSVPPQGIRVKVKPTGSPQVVEGGPDTAGNKPFYMVLNKGQNIGIAARLTGTRKVKVFHGPSLSQVFDDVRSDVTPQAQQILRDELIDAMRYILAKKYPPQPSV